MTRASLLCPRGRLAAVGLLFAVLAGTMSCGDRVAPTDQSHNPTSDPSPPPNVPPSPPPTAPSPSAIISDPVTLPPPSAQVAVVASGVAYASLLPGTFPNGILATISNRRTTTGVTAPLIAGGLDPVPIPAEAGDSLAFAIDTGGTQPVRFDQLVPLVMRPRVVRTDPPSGKRDVPLNLRILVVFSEPMDPASITGATLVLERAGTPVSGEIGVSGDGLQASFQPATDLLPESEYTIVVDGAIRDAGGSALEAPVTADFTTQPPGSAGSGAIEIVVRASGTDVYGAYAAILDEARLFVPVFQLSQSDGAADLGPVQLSNVRAGEHVVSLSAPSNCVVEDGRERSVTVIPGDLIRSAFTVACASRGTSGTLRITAPTTGALPSSTRYGVWYAHYGYWDYGGTFTYLGDLDPNGTLVAKVAASGVWPDGYWYVFSLGDVPGNCRVQDPHPYPSPGFTVPSGDTLEVEFPVTCSS